MENRFIRLDVFAKSNNNNVSVKTYFVSLLDRGIFVANYDS